MRRTFFAAGVALASLLAGCVEAPGGEPDAFCSIVRESAPALLDGIAPSAVGADLRKAAKRLRDHVPEALDDDVQVVATSDDPDELATALDAVTGYARASCSG